MQLIGTALILMMAAYWAGNTTKVQEWQPRPPQACRIFDTRYMPQYKDGCDAWFVANPA